MVTTAPFQLSLPGFSGPLDLLLRLIQQQRLDITGVSLVQVTEQYLAHLHSQKPADVAELSEFVAIGARLLWLKSRSLLPRTPEAAQEIEDAAADLTEALREYRRLRDGASHLRDRDASEVRAFPRIAPAPDLPPPPAEPLEPNLLLSLVRQALTRIVEEPTMSLPSEHVTTAECIERIVEMLQQSSNVSFRALIARCKSRLEIVVSFLAVLHLIKDGAIEAVQPEPFGDILLARIPSP